MTAYTYYIHQMHCTSCKLLVGDVLSTLGFKNINIDLKKKQITFDTDKKPDEFLSPLSEKLSQYNYSLSTSSIENAKTNLTLPLFISLFLVLIFLLLEQLGLSKFFNPQSITFPAIFTLGILASLSSCMAIVGGLVLSLGATKINMLTFHLSRLIGFFILGGFIGFLGMTFAITPFIQTLITFVFIATMLALGFSQLNLTKSISLPSVLGNKLLSLKNSTNPLLSVVLGAGTFILPCGFTQSMQLYSLTLKSPFQSALTMLVFALGTLPILASISITSNKLKNSKYLDIFQKTTAFLIIFFALFNLKILFRF